jgi:hypothetical protein
MDKYSGRFDNSVGKIVQMTREAVDPDRRNECSTGLHFCSPGYLSGFASPTDPIMIVKIDPADVVAIPADYQNQKGRTWRYEVVGQVPPNEVAMTFFGGKALVDSYQSAVVGNDDTYDSVTDGKWDACNAMEEDYEDVVDEDDVTNHNGITDNIFEGLSQVADSSTVMNKAIALPVVKAIKTVVTVPTTPTKTTARVFKTTAGVEFTAKQIKKAWKEAGSMRGGAKLIGVSKSTFAGWIASL